MNTVRQDRSRGGFQSKYQGMAFPDDVLRRLVPYSDDLPDNLKADKAEEAL